MQDGEGMWAAILSGSGGLGEESWFIVVNHRKHIAKHWGKQAFSTKNLGRIQNGKIMKKKHDGQKFAKFWKDS